jgi:predicted DNA-binding transcriptional regulator AlpA
LLSSTAPISTKRNQGIGTEPAGASQETECNKFEPPVDGFSGAQAVAGVPRWSPSPGEPRRKRRRSRPPAQGPPDYLNRVELLALVPLSMSSIDNLEKGGVFPSRFRLEPTTRVAWKRREVEKWLAKRAAKRVHQAPGAPDAVIECNGQGGETIDDLVVWPTAKPDAPRRQGAFQPKEDDHGA